MAPISIAYVMPRLKDEYVYIGGDFILTVRLVGRVSNWADVCIHSPMVLCVLYYRHNREVKIILVISKP